MSVHLHSGHCLTMPWDIVVLAHPPGTQCTLSFEIVDVNASDAFNIRVLTDDQNQDEILSYVLSNPTPNTFHTVSPYRAQTGVVVLLAQTSGVHGKAFHWTLTRHDNAPRDTWVISPALPSYDEYRARLRRRYRAPKRPAIAPPAPAPPPLPERKIIL